MAAPLDRHLVLIGFMGAGKSTIGEEVARRIERRFLDADEEIERRHGPLTALFERSEAEFRRLEEAIVEDALATEEPAVIALGGGALGSERSRALLRRRAFTVFVQVTPDEAWRRVAGSGRPLARDEQRFRALHAERVEIYDVAADAVARDADGVLLEALAIVIQRGVLERLPYLFQEPAALVADERVLGLHPLELDVPVHPVPSGEAAKTLSVAEGLWNELKLDRAGTVIALGGGTTIDLAGFVAATYLRGLAWIAVPTTLVGQIDAGIGGKTAVNLEAGKNLVGTFHYPERVVIDPQVLATLPERERRAGMAEVVKTGLLAGEELWDLPEDEMVRRCAAFKAAVCLSDPYERGRRAMLNLGHTFAHALEAASDYRLPHGDAVALGLLAALRLSGLPTDVVEEVLSPQPVEIDPERAWAVLGRDKKSVNGRPKLVLLERPGVPRTGVELPDEEIRSALESLIRH